MAGRKPNELLALARLAGDKTYIGELHMLCGTRERYTSTGSCIQCARMRQKAQREAFVARQAEDQGVGQTHAEAVQALDSFEHPELNPVPEEPLTDEGIPGYAEPWD